MSPQRNFSGKEYLYRDQQNDILVKKQSTTIPAGPVMTSDKSAADVYDHPVYREAGFKHVPANRPLMKRYRASFVVRKDEDGILCAADLDQGIFADGKTKEELMEDIREAVECHFDVPPEKVDAEVEILVTGLN